jgi:hypothetical protein
MKRFFIYLIIIAAISSRRANAQDSDTIPGPGELLGTLYGRLVNNYNDTVRIRVNDSIKVIIESYVKSDSVFNHKFSGLRYLGQIVSPDSAVKIVTWNLVLGNSPGKYFCYIIKRGAKGEKNRVYTLASDYREAVIKEDTTYSISDWYGALYYDIRLYRIDNITCWILLGIDYGNQLISRKIIEVLNITPEGSLFFGKKWFAENDKLSFRKVLEYGSSGMMTLRFASEKSIVFDHLVPFSPAQTGDRQFYGPDYSYDAFNLTDGIWKLKINVDARNKE